MSSSAETKLTGPAAGLIVAAVINAATGALMLLSTFLQLVTGRGQHGTFENEAEQAGYYFGRYGLLLVAVISIAAAPVIVLGAIKMMKARSYALAKTAAILAIIPCTSVCCLVSIPIGIWALVTLGKPEVKASFAQAARPGDMQPPPPYWPGNP